ncbi:AraC family transcriptional regulator [Novosphingobium sp.]|uniref:AraC family transcriptional regulator n=1 Tax=Novosphingobium sp. TaxID=1874826 RepID=UPI002FDDF67E
MLERSEVEPRARVRRTPLADGCAYLRAVPGDDGRVRQRLKVGRVEVDIRRFPTQRPVSITPTEAMVHVVVPIAGQAIVVGNGGSATLKPGKAFLLGSAEKTTCVFVAGARALLLHVPRASVQAVASRHFGDARRLAAIDCMFDLGYDTMDGGRLSVRSERRILDAMIDSLRASEQAVAIFPLARSVQRAVDHLRANPVLAWSIDDLSAVAGVTPGTLRRNFTACLGMSVTQLVLQLRIEWVRDRLESETESRSIGDLSVAAGFGASGMLNRTYQRHFGETPSQTRTRAFRSRRG